jgi:hypothetical protein
MYARTVRELALYRRAAVVAFCTATADALIEVSRHHAGHQALAELLAIFALLFWGTLDARMRDKTFHHGWALPFAATWPVSLAMYLVWTRGWRRGLKSYGAILGMMILGAIALTLAEALSTHPG